MADLIYKFLSPEEFYLLDEFFDREGVPRLDPTFAKVAAAIDPEKGKVVGFVTLQLVAHAEPIIIEEEYRGQGVWRQICRMIDEYATLSGVPGVFTQPNSEQTKHMAAEMGCVPCGTELWAKVFYDVNKLAPVMAQDADLHRAVLAFKKGE